MESRPLQIGPRLEAELRRELIGLIALRLEEPDKQRRRELEKQIKRVTSLLAGFQQ